MAAADVYSGPDGSNSAAAVSHEEIHINAAPGSVAHSIESPSAESLSDECLHSGWMSKRGYKIGCIPTWKRRFFILKGVYVFKFESPVGTGPKGAPIPVLGLTATIGPIDPKPSEHNHTMMLSTLRKEYVVGAGSNEELVAWIDAFARAKSISIKQQLGHAPLSASDEYANRSGALLTQKRLDQETEAMERRPAESTNF